MRTRTDPGILRTDFGSTNDRGFAGSSGGMHRLPTLPQCDADRVWGRASRCADHVGRRAAGRRRRFGRASFCRTSRQIARSLFGRGGDRSLARLGHQRRKAFQMDSAGQTADPQQARIGRNCRLLAVARRRNPCGLAEDLVALGATAAQGMFGRDFRVTRDRGRFISSRLAPMRLRPCILRRC